MSQHKGAAFIPALQGLRGLACLMIVLFHTHWKYLYDHFANGGLPGVSIFFCLSGFLITYHHYHSSLNPLYWLSFALQRFFRIYPALIAWLGCCWLFGKMGDGYFASRFSIANISDYLLLVKTSYVLWIVPVEIKFYVFFIALALVMQLARGLNGLLLTLLVLAWIACVIFPLPGGRMSLWPYLACFLGGIITCILHYEAQFVQRVPDFAWAVIAFLCLAGLLALYVPGVHIPTGWDHFRFFVPFTCLLILSVVRSEGVASAVLCSAGLRFMGAISFSLYLVHAYIFQIMEDVFAGHLPLGCIIFIDYAAALGVALLLYRFVEKPCFERGKKIAVGIYP